MREITKAELKKSPYYDDYDSTKQYTQLLARPGRVAQSREITQMQTTLKDVIKSLGDSIFKDGNIVEGCQVVISTKSGGVKYAKVTPGRVYLGGLVLPVTETELPIGAGHDLKGVGEETIGLKLVEYLVTSEDDSTLVDPALSYDNFSKPGCDRLKSVAVIVVNDSDSSILAVLNDGEVVVEREAPEYDTLSNLLANRTYEESGSYIVEGLSTSVESDSSDATKFNAVVEAGISYVRGYRNQLHAPRRISTERSTQTTSLYRNYTYTTSGVYILESRPSVASIISVVGSLGATLTFSNSSNTDTKTASGYLNPSQFVITYGSTTYTQGTDYIVTTSGNGFAITWRGDQSGAKTPPNGATYNVNFIYDYTFPSTDYSLVLTSDNAHTISWSTQTGHHPVNNGNFRVDYNLYLARKDIVCISRNGEISLIKGEPAEYGFEVAPDAPVDTLPISIISSPPNGSVSVYSDLNITVSNIGLTRFTMNDIQNILNRVKTMEYDQSVLALNEEARQYVTTSDKRGIFTDPLIDLSKIDYYFNLSPTGQKIDSSKPKYDAAVDLVNNLCYLPTKNATHTPLIDSVNSTASVIGRNVLLSKTGEQDTLLSQMKATSTFLVNPYSVYPNLPEISITPAVDTWIEDTIVEVPRSLSSSEIVESSTRHLENTQNVSVGGSHSWSTTTSSESSTVTPIGTRVSTSSTSNVVATEEVAYIRQREIEVSGSGFPANIGDIYIYFDGVKSSITNYGTYKDGTKSAIKADSDGNFKIKFMIPEKRKTGIREVLAKSDDTSFIESDRKASALYQASGIKRTIQNTVTTLTTILLRRVTTVTTNTTNYVDPVGQTFVLNSEVILSAVDLYFAAKGNTVAPVTCEIREVVNGTIGTTVYGSKTLPYSAIIVDGEYGSVATRFTFDEPILLYSATEYAFVVRTTSDQYRLWVATLGETDVVSRQSVLSNPYMVGVMMSSSNNRSWTIHQTTDIKFRLLADRYNSTSDLLFSVIAPDSISGFCRAYLAADSLIPTNTSVTWYYKTASSDAYKLITPYNVENLSNEAHQFYLKASLKSSSSNPYISPILALDAVGAVLTIYDNSDGGYYISNTISNLDSYTHIDVILDTYKPAGTGIEVYVSKDGLATKTQATLQSNPRNLDYGWKEETYKVTLSSATQCKLLIKMTSSYNYVTPAFRRVRMIMS